jgi:precorrin-4 methylase
MGSVNFMKWIIVYTTLFSLLGACDKSDNNQSDLKQNSIDTAAKQQTLAKTEEKTINSKDKCIYDEHSIAKGVMRIKVGDSLAAIVENSVVEGLDLYSVFNETIPSYTAIGENLQVTLDTDYGEIKINQTIALEFSSTGKMYVEENRNRVLAERFHKGVTVSTYPKYVHLTCLESVVNEYSKQFTRMGFEPVHLGNEKSWSEFNYLFSDSHSMDRLISYYHASWRREETGLQIAIVQWRSPNPSNKTIPEKLYNVNIRMSDTKEDWAWK